MSVVFFSDIFSPSSGYLTLVWRNPCWELRRPAFTIVFKVVWCSRKRFGPATEKSEPCKGWLRSYHFCKVRKPRLVLCLLTFWNSNSPTWGKNLVVYRKIKDGHTFQQKSTNTHAHTTGWASLHQFTPTLCVRGSSRSGEQMSSLLPSPLLPTQPCAAQRKHLSKHWPSAKGPHELAHPHFETRKTVCHSNCKYILSPARFLCLLRLAQQH